MERTLAGDAPDCGTATEARQPKRDLLGRLHQRRRELENELRRVNNSIEFVERNAALVEVVEIVLASREKCDALRPY